MLNGTFSVIFKHRVRFFFPKCDKYGCDYGLVRQDFPMRLTSWYAFTIIGCSRLRGGCANEANISLIPSFLKILRGNRICTQHAYLHRDLADRFGRRPVKADGPPQMPQLLLPHWLWQTGFHVWHSRHQFAPLLPADFRLCETQRHLKNIHI